MELGIQCVRKSARPESEPGKVGDKDKKPGSSFQQVMSAAAAALAEQPDHLAQPGQEGGSCDPAIDGCAAVTGGSPLAGNHTGAVQASLQAAAQTAGEIDAGVKLLVSSGGEGSEGVAAEARAADGPSGPLGGSSVVLPNEAVPGKSSRVQTDGAGAAREALLPDGSRPAFQGEAFILAKEGGDQLSGQVRASAPTFGQTDSSAGLDQVSPEQTRGGESLRGVARLVDADVSAPSFSGEGGAAVKIGPGAEAGGDAAETTHVTAPLAREMKDPGVIQGASVETASPLLSASIPDAASTAAGGNAARAQESKSRTELSGGPAREAEMSPKDGAETQVAKPAQDVSGAPRTDAALFEAQIQARHEGSADAEASAQAKDSGGEVKAPRVVTDERAPGSVKPETLVQAGDPAPAKTSRSESFSGAEAARDGRISVTDGRSVAETLAQEALKKLPRTVELSLDPPELGKVTVLLSQRGHDVTVKMMAGSAEAGKMLYSSAQDLGDALRQRGLFLAGFGVDSNGQGRVDTGTQEEHRAPSGRRRYARASAAEAATVLGTRWKAGTFDALA